MDNTIINLVKELGPVIVGSAIVAAGSFAALIIALFCTKIDMRKIRVVEAFILSALIVCRACGTRETVMKLADMITTEQRICVQEESKEILQAYQQLSDELSRWFVMFAVLGSFFGLVLPLGSYLLQIKAINDRDAEVDAKIKEREDRYEKWTEKLYTEMEKFRKEMARIQAGCANSIKKLWRGQAIVAEVRFRSAIRAAQDNEWKFSAPIRHELLVSLILMLKFLVESDSPEFIVKKVRSLADKVKDVKLKTLDVDVAAWTRGLTERTSKENLLALSSYCNECRAEFQTLKAFLEGFGLHVLM